MNMDRNNNNCIELRLAPSRFGEMPTLIPTFNSVCWPRIDNRKIKLFESELKNISKPSNFCVHIHVYYYEELELILKNLQESLDIIDSVIVTLPSNRRSIRDNVNKLLDIYTDKTNKIVIETENVGRNIKPMIIDAWKYISCHRYCLHLHTKRTRGPGDNYGLKWLKSICKTIATRQQILASQYLLEKNIQLGMILPKPFKETSIHSKSWAGTGNLAYQMLASYLQEDRKENLSELEF